MKSGILVLLLPIMAGGLLATASAAASTAASTAADSADPAEAGAPGDSAAFDPGRYQGKVVYLDFWASWCAPCKRSFPWMRAMQERYGRQGFAVVAVDVDRDSKAAEAFLAEHPVPFRIIHDPKGKLAQAYDIKAMPSSFVFDRSGHRRAAHVGFRSSEEDAMELEIRGLLAEAAPDSAADAAGSEP